MKSAVWEYFMQCDIKEAECNLCGRRIKRCGGTTGLRSHLRRNHPEIDFQEMQGLNFNDVKPVNKIKISKVISEKTEVPDTPTPLKLARINKCSILRPEPTPTSANVEMLQGPRKANLAFGNTDTEFDFFAKSLAVQLKNMPIHRALLCQERLQKVMTEERIFQLTQHDPLAGHPDQTFEDAPELISFTTIQEPNEEYRNNDNSEAIYNE